MKTDYQIKEDEMNQTYLLQVWYKDGENYSNEFRDIEEAERAWNEEAKWENTLQGAIYSKYPFRENGDFEKRYRGDFA